MPFTGAITIWPLQIAAITLYSAISVGGSQEVLEIQLRLRQLIDASVVTETGLCERLKCLERSAYLRDRDNL
jgi:hypothetical protein